MIHSDPLLHALHAAHDSTLQHSSESLGTLNGLDLPTAFHALGDALIGESGALLGQDIQHMVGNDHHLGAVHDAGSVVGTPDHDQLFWHPQTAAFTCAVMAQQGIIHEFTGQDVDEPTLCTVAAGHGWLTEHGTSPEDVGQLLEHYGVPSHAVDHAGIGDIMLELAEGHKVIVAVRSQELWHSDHPLNEFARQAADHAVWVTGIDASDPAHPMVIINDSGTPDGAGNAYALDRFVDAWKGSEFNYVATDHAPPDIATVCPDFDRHTGFIDGLSHWIADHVPDVAMVATAAFVGHEVADAAGSLVAGIIADVSVHKGLERLVAHSRPHPELSNKLHDGSSILLLDSTARDRLFLDL